MSETIDRVIEVIVANRRKFKEFCFSLTDEELMRPVPDSTWIVRDFAAHLGTLDVALVGWMRALQQGGESLDSTRNDDGTPFDVDAFNEAHVVERRSWPLRKVFDEAATNRSELIDVFAALTDEEIDRPMHFGGDAKRKAGDLQLKLFLAGWAQHDPIHAADMLKALPERAADPALRAWLDNPFVAGYQAIMNRTGV